MRHWLLSGFLIAALGALPAAAEKPDHAGQGGKGKSKAAAPDAPARSDPGHREHDDGDIDVHFSIGLRDGWRDWYGEEYGRGHCPPGLAKKHNGCLPPGQAKKRYAIGHPLPPEVVILAIPIPLSRRLGPPPHGYRYGIVDGDLVKLAIGTLLVVDAIDGLID